MRVRAVCYTHNFTVYPSKVDIASPATSARGVRSRVFEFTIVALAAFGLTCVMTWPLITDPGGLARLRLNDARWSIWVVAWVAHALTSNPVRLFDANIFYPHQGALFLSEPNLLAGFLAAPAWVLTRNPVLAHNVAFLASFVLSAVATYYLAKYLVASRAAAAVAAVIFAFCPYVFAHTAHIHLEMTAGLPLVLWAIHRHVDRPSVGRGLAIGLAMALQATACGYYAVLTGLIAPAAIVFFAASRRYWRHRVYWLGAIAGAALCALAVVPLFLPYLGIRDVTGFSRSLESARVHSATWQSYLASAAWAHRWWLGSLGQIPEVLFPGFGAVLLGAFGAWIGWRTAGRRELAAFYLALVLLSIWLSLGPSGGLFLWLHDTVPVFSFLRAPGRFGLAAVLGFAVLSAIAVERVAMRLQGRGRIVAGLLPLLVAAELFMAPLPFVQMPRVPASYRLLATLPEGPVAEFPFYRLDQTAQFHALYMLFSTYHWQPMINGYSDIFPEDFSKISQALATFPEPGAIATLESLHAKYLIVNYPRFDVDSRQRVDKSMHANRAHFRELLRDEGVTLYEVMSWPSPHGQDQQPNR